MARQRADSPGHALLSGHALDRLWTDQIRTPPAAPPRRRARRRQRAGRGRNVSRDSRRNDSRRQHRPPRQRCPHRRRGRHGRRHRRLADRATDPFGAAVVWRGPAAHPPGARHARRRRLCGRPSTPAAADTRDLVVLAVRPGHPVRPSGLRERRPLRERAGGDDDAGAVRDGRRRRFDSGGAAAQGRSECPLRPVVRSRDGRLCDRSEPGERDRASGGDPRRRADVPRPARKLARHRRPRGRRDGRRALHGSALRPDPARERAEPPVPRHCR